MGDATRAMNAHVQLRTVKLLHTGIWAFFAGSIVALPFFAWQEKFAVVAVIAVLVTFEGLVLAFNAGRCPLTDVAARYTDDRRDNYDIYLPEWLARYNKPIFTLLFVAGLALAAYRWMA